MINKLKRKKKTRLKFTGATFVVIVFKDGESFLTTNWIESLFKI